MDDEIAKRGRRQANTIPNLKRVLADNRFLTDDRHFPAQNRPNRAAPDDMPHGEALALCIEPTPERFMRHFYRSETVASPIT